MQQPTQKPENASIPGLTSACLQARAPMRCAAVIFDLDGTLLDSLADLAMAVNQSLVSLGYRPHPTKSYRRFIGDGMRQLVRRALPPVHRRDADVEQCLALVLQRYSRCWDQHTQPYPGVPELLDALGELHVPVAVFTNKPHEVACQVVARLLPRWFFQAVIGTGPGVPDKPDPTGALLICSLLDADPGASVYLGDSGADMQAAARAGMLAAGATWGFRTASELAAEGAQHLVNTPVELLKLLEGAPCFA